MTVFDLASVKMLVQMAVAEDIGRGDLTTQLTVSAGVRGRAEIVAKQDGVLAGLPLLAQVFHALGATAVEIREHLADGASFTTGTVIAELSGAAADLLAGERVALNFLQHLSGIATITRQYVTAVAGTGARVVDTRKTVPGLRLIEKYAVRLGGGSNHRLGLDDGILIKDNHIVAAGGIAAAVERAHKGAPHTMKIEVECTDLAEVDAALAAGTDAILLDNMSVADLAVAVKHINHRVLVEASGGVTLETIRAIAETGVDLISVGALTHSAPAIDLSMRIAVEA
jgi:nicotinate-nucleotide pyrophosphorylase (carboxylating)